MRAKSIKKIVSLTIIIILLSNVPLWGKELVVRHMPAQSSDDTRSD